MYVSACICLLQIEDARVIMDRENPFRSRGFGFVTYTRPEDAVTAVEKNHDKELQVRVCNAYICLFQCVPSVLSLWDGESCTIVRSGFDFKCCMSRMCVANAMGRV